MARGKLAACVLAAACFALSWAPAVAGPRESPGLSRLQRRSLALDFVVPSLFRTYVRELVLGPPGSAAARCRLRLDCAPLLRAARGGLPQGAPPGPPYPPVGGPLAAGRRLRRAKQLVLEVGEGSLRDGCAGEPPPGSGGTQLEFNLTELFAWWLRSGDGRLRVRLMPERRGAVPGSERGLSAAIRAARPRLLFHVSAAGRSASDLPASSSSHPPGYSAWNLTWVMRDTSPFFSHRGRHIFDCNFESPCELEYSLSQKDQGTSNNAWLRLSGEEISQLNIPDGPERDHSEDTSKDELRPGVLKLRPAGRVRPLRVLSAARGVYRALPAVGRETKRPLLPLSAPAAAAGPGTRRHPPPLRWNQTVARPLTRLGWNQTVARALTRLGWNQTVARPLTRLGWNQTVARPLTRLGWNQTVARPLTLLGWNQTVARPLTAPGDTEPAPV
ncbi:ALK tyrosine kinase receptor-like [Pogoniulus pusillus]|uniref:ALK tyrosine kinase receptor-like n=1 Tax=Pogoniulus pusillus TaxID=488313 RepID=UPI0030B96A9C